MDWRTKFDCRQGQRVFHFATASRPALPPLPASYQMGVGGSFLMGEVAGAWS